MAGCSSYWMRSSRFLCLEPNSYRAVRSWVNVTLKFSGRLVDATGAGAESLRCPRPRFLAESPVERNHEANRVAGKAERFIQTALREWACARPYQNSEERKQKLNPWRHEYNFRRPHSSHRFPLRSESEQPVETSHPSSTARYFNLSSLNREPAYKIDFI